MDLKTYINEQLDVRLKPINDEIASLKLELKQRVADIANLKSEIVDIKSINEQLASANKSLEARFRGLSSRSIKRYTIQIE